MQLGLMDGRSTTDDVFLFRQLKELFAEQKNPLHHIFVDREKPCFQGNDNTTEFPKTRYDKLCLCTQSRKPEFAGPNHEVISMNLEYACIRDRHLAHCYLS